MKKTSIIVLICILIVFCLGTYACFSCDPRSKAYKDIIDRKETDGLFYYFYNKKMDAYVITGDSEEKNPEIMYIQPFYNGKEVKLVYYEAAKGLLFAETFGPSFLNVKRVYVPFNNPVLGGDPKRVAYPQVSEVFYPVSSTIANDLSYFFLSDINNVQDLTIYFNFEKYLTEKKEWINELNSSNNSSILNDYEEYPEKIVFFAKDHSSLLNITLQSANVKFCFNYENSPNGGVFFIDNYGYGESIKNPPYDPIREGYTFEGWYKESECINKWNFETDTLPIVEYDEDGNPVEFIETKLYAKWIKN